MDFQVRTLKERTDLADALRDLNRRSWPDFIIHGDPYGWGGYYKALSDFILLLTNDNELIGGGFTVPVVWNGKGDDLPGSIEAIIEKGMAGRPSSANTLIPVAAIVEKRFRSEGLSTDILKQMKKLAIERGFQNMVVPVRPTWKTRYPLQSMARYANWRNKDGMLYDPWLRTHERLGAAVLKCVDSTLKIEGTIEAWEQWTGMVFPDSGEYVVRHALQPVQIDVAANRGVYHEPNVWMQHPMP